MSYNKHTVGSFLQQLKNYDANQSIESLLHDEEFASLLRSIFISLPSEFQSTAREMLTKTNQREKKKTKSPALSAVIEIQNIALPPTIQDHYWLWKENPSRFWHPVGISHANQSVEFIAVEAYLAVRRLRQRQVHDTILWRLHASFFYQLALLLGQGKRLALADLHNNRYQRLVKALAQCEKITDEETVIKANLQLWAATGSRYNKICMALDKGALFLLPHISDAVWENTKYLKGAEFGDAMSHLRSQGIMELSVQLEADVVANRILNAALDPFKWDVVDSRTFAANQSIEAKIVSIEPYAESKVVEAGSSIVSQAVTAGPSSGPRALDTKLISITSLLNPPDAAHQSDEKSRDINLHLQSRNSTEKPQRIN
ncbi:uncharacterized protein EAE97_007225 [Botrytis byssoidea]|uniref:Uncharacterized protein n=1 Tax=Botrytis byssoidea TaxID=139641 RepID=A0A9P5M183_9HELO|nr:uncharacterized protein EAE97_007225 [Botrytis byssoidea]KAF7939144.1 hypothetical protein EAE97_007225 [Botrytis byssoidea]